jgi:Peptidase family M1 domain
MLATCLPVWAQVCSQVQNAGELYQQLSTIGLDKTRVYRIRDAALDRENLHITFQDGKIGFTQDVCGRITGAFFEGDGEVLLRPPQRAERASLALFTGMAVLEEQFATAFVRFDDDTFRNLQEALRPSDNVEDFMTAWAPTVQRLSDIDALRLIMDFSAYLPSQDAPGNASPVENPMMHARLQGKKLGAFDIYYDRAAQENIWVAQLKSGANGSFINMWTSFSKPSAVSSTVPAPESRRDDVTVDQYRVVAGVRPPKQLDVEATLDLVVKRGGQRAILFELSRYLNLQSVQWQGRSLEFIHNQALEGSQLSRRGNDLVAVIFPRVLKNGEKIELRFVYGGEVISEAGIGLLYVGARGTWYPNLGLAMSKFDLEFHYPSPWTLVATGRQVPIDAAQTRTEKLASAGDQAARWVSERPIPVAGFNLGKYARATAKAGTVQVDAYATGGVESNFPKPPSEIVSVPSARRPGVPTEAVVVAPAAPSPARNAQAVADRSARAVSFFSQRFGPYPYSTLAMTQLPGELSQGWPGLVFLSTFAYLSQAERSQLQLDPVQSILSSQVLVHEIAHQWWGDLVAWRGYRDQWWVEALSNYSSLMMLEQENPAHFRAVMDRYRDDLFRKNKDGAQLKDAGPVTFGGRLSSSLFPDGYDAISYGRGTWLFHMLHSMLRHGSDDGFARALLKLRQRYQGKLITTEELISVFEEELPIDTRYEGKKSLKWFLDGWVNGTAIPKLELSGAKFSSRDQRTVITGKIVQHNAPADLVAFVPIYGQSSANGPLTLIGNIFADGPETTFRLNSPKPINKLVLDPEQTLLIER